MKNMIADGYAGRAHAGAPHRGGRGLARQARSCCEADADAEYAAVIEIDLADIKEPVLCCPNDPDDAKLLSDVAGTKIDEVFIGSCMTNIGHFRAAAKLLEGKRDIPVKLWVAPPTKMDASRADQGRPLRRLRHRRRAHRDAGLQPVHGQPGAGARRRDGGVHLDAQLPQPPGQEHQRVPGLGRAGGDRLQARAASRRVAEYHADMGVINADGGKVYRYMNFDQIDEYAETAK